MNSSKKIFTPRKKVSKKILDNNSTKQGLAKGRLAVQNLWSLSSSETQLWLQRFRWDSNRTPNMPVTGVGLLLYCCCNWTGSVEST